MQGESPDLMVLISLPPYTLTLPFRYRLQNVATPLRQYVNLEPEFAAPFGFTGYTIIDLTITEPGQVLCASTSVWVSTYYLEGPIHILQALVLAITRQVPSCYES